MGSAKELPFLAALFELPENQELFKEYIGIDDLEVPGASAALQQRREIEELLASQPVPPSPEQIQASLVQMAQKASQIMAQSPGLPPPPPPDIQQIVQSLTTPSVPVDTVWDFHQQHIQAVQDWLASEARYEQEALGNTQGIENVKLHGQMHKNALQQQQAQQPNTNQKPPSTSISLKDLPPDGQQQLAAQAGIKIAPPVALPAQGAQNG
jgi:hypothetical protein